MKALSAQWAQELGHKCVTAEPVNQFWDPRTVITGIANCSPPFYIKSECFCVVYRDGAILLKYVGSQVGR